MAGRSMTMKEINAQGFYMSERRKTGSVDDEVSARILAAMRKSGLSAADAFKQVLSEDWDLGERYRHAHGKPIELCENPSNGRALADFISVDRNGIERSGAVRQSSRFLGIGE